MMTGLASSAGCSWIDPNWNQPARSADLLPEEEHPAQEREQPEVAERDELAQLAIVERRDDAHHHDADRDRRALGARRSRSGATSDCCGSR